MSKEDVTGSLRLTGRVVDDRGAAVPGVQVRLAPGDRTATTDENGDFAFERLASRRYRLSAKKDDLYAGPAVVRIADDTEPAVLQLHCGATLVVHVTANGSPFRGAKVYIDRQLAATTDKNGIATVRGLSPEYHDGWVTADGWANAMLHSFVHEDPGGVIERFVMLRPGARVEGVALGPQDTRVPGASIMVCTLDGRFAAAATADKKGAWRIDALEGGTYRVTATSDEYCSDDPTVIDCDGRKRQRDVVVRLLQGAEVLGTVVDKAGAPVRGARVDAQLYGASGKHVDSDDAGAFQITGLPPGEYYVDAATPTQASGAAHLQLERGNAVDIQLVLEPSRVAGIVVDETGAPVVEATVRALACGSYVPWRLEVRTDSRGYFDLGPLQVGEYDLYATWPGTRTHREAPATARVHSSNANIRLELPAPCRVTGRLLLKGKPLSYFGAALVREREMPGGRAVGISDADGRFTLIGEPGNWRLALIADGTKLKIIGEINFAERRAIDLGDVAMERGQRITGHVRDPRGKAVPGARVKIDRGADLHANESRVRRWFAGDYETTTNEDGAYAFEGIGRPEWIQTPPFISALHEKTGASRVELLPEGDATIDLVLLGSGALDGLVEGAGHRHRFVQALGPSEPERARWMSVDRAGAFRFENLPEGEYVVTLSGGDEVVAPEKAVVAAGRRAKVKLVMKSSTVRLTIRVPRGREKDLRVERVDGDAAKPVSRSTMRMERQITFDEVAPGDYRATLDGTTWTQISVMIADPPEQIVVLSG